MWLCLSVAVCISVVVYMSAAVCLSAAVCVSTAVRGRKGVLPEAADEEVLLPKRDVRLVMGRAIEDFYEVKQQIGKYVSHTNGQYTANCQRPKLNKTVKN